MGRVGQGRVSVGFPRASSRRRRLLVVPACPPSRPSHRPTRPSLTTPNLLVFQISSCLKRRSLCSRTSVSGFVPVWSVWGRTTGEGPRDGSSALTYPRPPPPPSSIWLDRPLRSQHPPHPHKRASARSRSVLLISSGELSSVGVGWEPLGHGPGLDGRLGVPGRLHVRAKDGWTTTAPVGCRHEAPLAVASSSEALLSMAQG